MEVSAMFLGLLFEIFILLVILDGITLFIGGPRVNAAYRKSLRWVSKAALKQSRRATRATWRWITT